MNTISEKSPHSANLLGNESEVNLEVQEPINEILKTLSEAPKILLEPLSHSEQIYPQIKIKSFTGPISPFWGKFQNKRESKLLKEDFNFKLSEKFR